MCVSVGLCSGASSFWCHGLVRGMWLWSFLCLLSRSTDRIITASYFNPSYVPLEQILTERMRFDNRTHGYGIWPNMQSHMQLPQGVDADGRTGSPNAQYLKQIQ